MSKDEYKKVELPAINQLKSLDWTYIEGAKLSPDDVSKERRSYKDVVLKSRLSQSIKKINPWINDENLRKIVRSLTQISNSNVIEVNQEILKKIQQYVSVEQDLGEGRRYHTVKIIDFDNPQNNEFIATNQFKITGPNQNIIPDIVLFVNGLPLAVIECKSPYITNPMEAGINQLLRYSNNRNPEENEGAEKLFYYNQLMVSTYFKEARLGSITARYEHYLEWKDVYPKNIKDFENNSSQEVLLEGVFNHTNFLDMIRNFNVFEVEEGRTIKKTARYQQYRAVHKTIAKLQSGETKKEKGGVIWHTQGSGKSLTMVFLAMQLRRHAELKKYKLIFLTDRTQLDSQLTTTFKNTQDETVINIDSVKELREVLKKNSSDLITSTIQKFQEMDEDNQVLNESENIIVLIDEGHRTQYGSFGLVLNTALPNAPKIAFTGTPLIKSQKTSDEFGDYIDTYTIEQAVEDGATLQILYEGREVKTSVEGESLDNLFDVYFADKTDEEKKEIKRKYAIEKAVLEAPKRIRWACIDIIKHYRDFILPNGFKGMIVTSSRKAAVLYKKTLDELDGPGSAVVISGDHNDPQELKEFTDPVKHKEIINDFVKKDIHESKYNFIIVKDMLLTGFDAPICQVMYLDRKLIDHSLLQAIARVNRTKKDKQRGYVVDYYGLANYLTSALEQFTTDEIQGALYKLEDEIPKLERAHTNVMKFFKDKDIEDIDESILALEDDNIRQSFEINFRNFAKQMDIVLPDKAAGKYLKDLKYLGKIVHGARNTYRDEQLNIVDAGAKVKKLIDEHITSTGVDPAIPPINLLDERFNEHVNQQKSPQMRATEVKNAIKHHLNIKLDDDPAYYRKLSQKLDEIIQRHHEHWEELLEQLLLFKKEDLTEDHPTPQGVSDTERPFYNLCAEFMEKNNEDDPAIHQTSKQISNKLVEFLIEAHKIVDFFNKPDEIRRLKREIKNTFLEHTTINEDTFINTIIEDFMDLAKHRFRN